MFIYTIFLSTILVLSFSVNIQENVNIFNILGSIGIFSIAMYSIWRRYFSKILRLQRYECLDQ